MSPFSIISAHGVPGFDDHCEVHQIHVPEEKLEGFIAIHRCNPGYPSFGATRMKKYDSNGAMLTDVLRLSQLMTFKARGAGLPYGGAKGVLQEPKGKYDRKNFFTAYAKVVNSLEGKFITGSDIGLNDKDVAVMRKHSPFIVGLTADAVHYTGIGVYDAILETLEVLGETSMPEITITIQGVGKTGTALLERLYPAKPKIYVTDVDMKRLDEIGRKFPGAIRVEPEDIYDIPATIFSPCAVGGTLNAVTINRLRVKAVVGSANNQLLSPTDAELLMKKGILYAPDFIVNAGGLISVTQEYEQPTFLSEEGILKKIDTIRDRLHEIYIKSRKTGENTFLTAQKLFR